MTRSQLRAYIELLGDTRELEMQPCPECEPYGNKSDNCQHCGGHGDVLSQASVDRIADEIMRKPVQREEKADWQVGHEERAWRRW